MPSATYSVLEEHLICTEHSFVLCNLRLFDVARPVVDDDAGTRVAVAYQSEIKLLGQSLYYLLTTGSGQQTLGEEYCDISQVATSHGLPPTPARRILFILYQTTVPYLAERMSSRIVARSMALNESQFDDHPESDNPSTAIAQSTTNSDTPSRSLSVPIFSRLRGRVHALWVWVLQKWPAMLPFAQDFIQLTIRANLMMFYFEGLYYHLPKRAAGIRYVFIGRGIPVLSEDGNIISDIRSGKTADMASHSEASSGMSKCTLCLSTRQNPTATTCGHVFCWTLSASQQGLGSPNQLPPPPAPSDFTIHNYKSASIFHVTILFLLPSVLTSPCHTNPTMICLKAFSSPLHLPTLRRLNRSSASALRVAAAASMSSSYSSAVETPIEHIVLIKVRPEAAASGAAAAMVSALQALSTQVPGLAYIHAGPVLRLRSPAAEALGPTHLLHSRYAAKPDLAAYATHPAHVAAVQGHVLPNALDTTAVDWVNVAPAASPVAPGSAVRLTLAKAKEGVEPAQLVEAVAAATKAAADARGAKVSFGENFSPARAKGYQFGMVAVFDSVEELDAVEGDGKVEEAKAAVRPLLDEVLVLDFVAGPAGEASTPASL
ncbi:hypothetical protein EJB05_11347, partial [Eragrostis curvula]